MADETFNDNYTISNNEIVLQNSDSDEEAFIRSVTASTLIIDITEESDPGETYSYTLFFDRL